MPLSPESMGHVSRIPKVRELRDQLGFRDQSSITSKIFNDTLRAFRRSYKTSDGINGIEFHDWKSREHHTQLAIMVRSFLSANKDGKEFWPHDHGDIDSQTSCDGGRNLSYLQDQEL